MKLNDLRPAPGAVRKRKRIGRGTGSGRGGTATKGHKGQQARSGAPKGKSFEGGQMKLTRRIPKFGFHNPFRIEYRAINVGRLEERFEDGATVDVEALIAHGLMSKKLEPVKVLGTGELRKKLDVRVAAASATARQKIEAAGGTLTLDEASPAAKKRARGKKKAPKSS